jgi:hypothetical protein
MALLSNPPPGAARILSIQEMLNPRSGGGLRALVQFETSTGLKTEIFTPQRCKELGLEHARRRGWLVPIPMPSRAPEMIPAGFARILLVAPAQEEFALGDLHFRVDYETSDGPGSVTLSPKRVRSLGLLDPTRWGRIVLIPTP